MLANLNRYEEGYPYVSNAALLMFCGYVITWYLQLGYRIPVLGTIRFEFIYAAVLTIVAILSTPKPNVDCPVVKWVVLLFITMIIQIPFSYNVEHSWNVFIDRVVKFSFMGFFIVRFVRSPKHLIFFVGTFLLACMKMGQEGFWGKITGNMVWENQGIMRLHGSTPLYAHPNSFAGMALGSLPFIVNLFPFVNRFIASIFIIHGIFMLNILLHSGSRTAYVAFVCFLMYISVKKNKKFLAVISLLLILPILTNYEGGQYLTRLESVYTMKDKEGSSIEKRKEIISDSITIFFENPFGVGVSAFPFVREARFGRNQDTHNLYLEIATNLGVQGFVAFFGMVLSMLKVLTEIVKRMESFVEIINEKKMEYNKKFKRILEAKIIIACSSAIYMFVVIRLILGLFGMDLYEIYWWFSLGLTVSLFGMSRKIEKMDFA